MSRICNSFKVERSSPTCGMFSYYYETTSITANVILIENSSLSNTKTCTKNNNG